MIQQLKGNKCLSYKDYFNNIINIDISSKSNGYIYNYMYSLEIYNTIKNDYFKSLSNLLDVESKKYTLFLVSQPKLNSKLNLVKKDLINPISSIPIEKTNNVILGDKLIKTALVPIKTKEDLIKVLDYLYSGYYSHSFIMYDISDFTEVSDLFHINKNQTNVDLDYRIVKEKSHKIYLTYGGFDFGHFLFVSF